MAKTLAEESTDDIERIEVPTGEADDVKIDLDPPGDADDEPQPVAARPERERDPKTGKWTEKKQARARDHKEAKAWEREKADYERRLQETRAETDRRIAEIQATTARQIAEAVAARGGTNVPQDPHDAALAEIQAALEAELVILGNQDTPNYKRYNELRRKEQETIIAKALAAREKAQPQQNQRQNPYAGRTEFINNEFPWTLEPRCAPLNKKAWAYRTYLIETVGRPDTLDTDREALAHIQAEYGAEFGLRGPAKPRQEQREFYSSRPAPGGTPPERNGRPKSVILPGRLAHGHGLSDEALRLALAADDQ